MWPESQVGVNSNAPSHHFFTMTVVARVESLPKGSSCQVIIYFCLEVGAFSDLGSDEEGLGVLRQTWATASGLSVFNICATFCLNVSFPFEFYPPHVLQIILLSGSTTLAFCYIIHNHLIDFQ